MEEKIKKLEDIEAPCTTCKQRTIWKYVESLSLAPCHFNNPPIINIYQCVCGNKKAESVLKEQINQYGK